MFSDFLLKLKSCCKAKSSKGLVDFLDIDRPLYKDNTKMKGLVKSCEILNEVEKAVGSLEEN